MGAQTPLEDEESEAVRDDKRQRDREDGAERHQCRAEPDNRDSNDQRDRTKDHRR